MHNLLEIVENLARSGKNISQLNRDLLEYFKEVCIIKTCTNAGDLLNLPENIFNQMKTLADKSSAENLISIFDKAIDSVEASEKEDKNEIETIISDSEK